MTPAFPNCILLPTSKKSSTSTEVAVTTPAFTPVVWNCLYFADELPKS